MVTNEKRVKLGVDIGELSNQLLQVDNLIENNYKKSIQGQIEYNEILKESISLLEKQAEIVEKLNQTSFSNQNQITNIYNNNESENKSQNIQNNSLNQTTDLISQNLNKNINTSSTIVVDENNKTNILLLKRGQNNRILNSVTNLLKNDIDKQNQNQQNEILIKENGNNKSDNLNNDDFNIFINSNSLQNKKNDNLETNNIKEEDIQNQFKYIKNNKNQSENYKDIINDNIVQQSNQNEISNNNIQQSEIEAQKNYDNIIVKDILISQKELQEDEEKIENANIKNDEISDKSNIINKDLKLDLNTPISVEIVNNSFEDVINNIYSKISEFNLPIPVEVVNVPLPVVIENNNKEFNSEDFEENIQNGNTSTIPIEGESKINDNYSDLFDESIPIKEVKEDNYSNLFGESESVPIGGGEDELEDRKTNSFEDISNILNNIYDRFLEFNIPIPVEVVNVPLPVTLEGDNLNGENDSNTIINNQQNNNQGGGSSIGGNLLKIFGAASILNGLGTASSLIGSSASDPNYLLAGLAGMIPVIGPGLSSILSKMIQEAEERMRAQAEWRGTTGGYMDFIPLHQLGYKNAEAYRKEAQYYPSNIRLSLSDLEFEKGYGISSGTMDSLLRSMRQEVDSNFSSILGINYLQNLSNLENQGIDWEEEVRGYSEDYLKILVELNQRQLEVTGETNSLINGEIIREIAKTSEKFGDPAVLANVTSSIQGGLIQAPSPQAEALQYWAMSQANPEADIWQMQLMRENPFSEESRGYFSNYIDALMQTGNANDVRFNIMNAFGLTAHQTEAFVGGIEKAKSKATELFNRRNNLSTDDYEFYKDYFDEQGNLKYTNERGEFDLTRYLEGRDINALLDKYEEDSKTNTRLLRSEASAATSGNDIMIASIADKLANGGDELIQFTHNNIMPMVGKFVDVTSDILSTINVFFESGFKEGLRSMLKEFGDYLLGRDIMKKSKENEEYANRVADSTTRTYFEEQEEIIINSTEPNNK